ncbi:MAG: ParA family protein [Clostridiales bacterium]|nr:ParA family protein [Flavonifractor sp.]MDU2195942.1 ParA family protein [Clostridiales bacterium]
MKTIAIVNLKGGVGKTVTAVNVAAILATEYGQRVLLVDADPQANATQSLLPPGEYNTLAGLLLGQEPYYENLCFASSIRGLDIVPADDDLRNLDVDLLQGQRPDLRAIRDLRDAVMEDAAYDVMVIDCPPALSPACAAAIAASTDVVIPIKVDAYSVRGMNELTAQIDRLRSIYPDVHVAGCLPTMWYRSDTVEQGERLLREHAPVHVFATHIRRSPKVDDSTWTGEPVVSWSPRSAAAQDYRAFVAELLEEGVIDGR